MCMWRSYTYLYLHDIHTPNIMLCMWWFEKNELPKDVSLVALLGGVELLEEVCLCESGLWGHTQYLRLPLVACVICIAVSTFPAPCLPACFHVLPRWQRTETLNCKPYNYMLSFIWVFMVMVSFHSNKSLEKDRSCYKGR